MARIAQQAEGAARLADSLNSQPANTPTGSTQRSATPSDASLGREIRELRRAQGRTQKELARMVGVTGAQLHRYEAGTTRISASRLIIIANALGIRPDVLIAAGSVQEPPTHPEFIVASSPASEIAELLQAFFAITDPKRQSALVLIAKMMAG